MFRKLFTKSRGANSKSSSTETLSTEGADGLPTEVTGIVAFNKGASKEEGLEEKEETHKNLFSEDSIKTLECYTKIDQKAQVAHNDPSLNTSIKDQQGTPLVCHPCLEKNERRPAEMWCTLCHETLCDHCNSHHAVFKATRNHTVISILEYKNVLSTLKNYSFLCSGHPENPLDHYCVQHRQPFCCSCEMNNHRDCKIKQIDQMIGDSKHIEAFDKSFERMNSCMRFSKDMFENRNSTKASMNDMREHFLNNLKVKRSEVNSWLDKVEREALMQFEQKYLSEKEKIEKEFIEFDSLTRKIQHRLEIGYKIAPFKGNPTTEMFHAMLQLTNDTDKEYKNLKAEQDLFYNVSLDGNISYEISESEKTVKMVNDFQFVHSPCDIKIDYTQVKKKDQVHSTINDSHHQSNIDDEILVSSSVVEKEEDNILNIKIKHDNIPNTNIKNKDSQITEAKSNNTKQNIQKHIPASICTKATSSHMEPYSETRNSSPYCDRPTCNCNDFVLLHSFFVQKAVNTIQLADVAILPNNELAILEISTPRLLVYAKDGKRKRGQIFLLHTPSCLTKYRSEEVAVTLPRIQKVAIIYLQTLTLYRYIDVEDECHGICTVNNQLVVSCVNHGLKLVDDSGTVLRVISKLKGELYICNGGDCNVFTLKKDSKMVVRYNINNNRRANFHVGGCFEPKGITVDNRYELVFSCDLTDEIYKKEDVNTPSKNVIWIGIQEPTRICYDRENNELVVINNDEKSISIFHFH